jgi:hypothetical protein
VRCFQAAGPTGHKQYDIRYSIEVPLLVRFESEIQKAGPIEFIVIIDGTPVGSIPTQIVAQKTSMDFLAPVQPALIDKLEGAKKTILVMPRQKNEGLDGSCRFVATQVPDPTRGLQSEGLRLLATS